MLVLSQKSQTSTLYGPTLASSVSERFSFTRFAASTGHKSAERLALRNAR